MHCIDSTYVTLFDCLRAPKEPSSTRCSAGCRPLAHQPDGRQPELYLNGEFAEAVASLYEPGLGVLSITDTYELTSTCYINAPSTPHVTRQKNSPDEQVLIRTQHDHKPRPDHTIGCIGQALGDASGRVPPLGDSHAG